jgi:hypothetical protein
MKAFRAKDEIRTRDPDLGKVVLYQLSYFRILVTTSVAFFLFDTIFGFFWDCKYSEKYILCKFF